MFGKPTVYWLSKCAEMLAKIAPLVGSVLSFFMWMYGIIGAAIVGAISAIDGLMQQLDLSFLRAMTPNTIMWIGYANAVFPLAEILEALTLYYTAWGIVILIRWLKSIIPTLAN